MAQPSMYPSHQMSLTPFTPFTPAAYGRSSSPLNPHSHPPSSSPLTSPTPLPSTSRFRPFSVHSAAEHDQSPAAPSKAASASMGSTFMSLYSPAAPAVPIKRPSTSSRQSLPSTSFSSRPTAPRANSSPGSSSRSTTVPVDIFSDTPGAGPSNSGASPLEGQMWRDRLGRRMNERERRAQARTTDLAERRGISVANARAPGRDTSSGRRRAGVAELEDAEWDEEAERQQAAEDEEVYRRLMLLQRRKAQHAAMVSYERETGGSDPISPDFWEEEEQAPSRSGFTGHADSHWYSPETETETPTTFDPGHKDIYLTPPRAESTHTRPRVSLTAIAQTQAEADAAQAAEAALAEQIERDMAEIMTGPRTSEAGYEDDEMELEEYDWDELDQLEQAARAAQTTVAMVGNGDGGEHMDVDMA